MLIRTFRSAFLGASIAVAAATIAAPASAQITVSPADDVAAGELAVPLNKSQVLRTDRPFAKALIGSPDIADVLPLSDSSLYVLGKKMGTTSLTLYDRSNRLIAVVDVAVGPDVISLKRQLNELMGENVGARISNDSIVLEGIVSSGPAADRAVQLAETYAPGKVINMLSIGSTQQVMLEVRFSEIKRGALKDIGFSSFITGGGDNGFLGAIGNGASLTPSLGSTTTTVPLPGGGTQTVTTPNPPTLSLGSIVDSFGVLTRVFHIAGLDIDATFNALERKGLVTTLAEPTLVALSGETASFLAGGEFPIPVAQSGTGGEGGNSAISVEFKQFGVSLAFTPTVLADGVINMEVAPEVSSIDPSASVVINNLRVPGLQTRRAKTTVELRDGESFAMAGLIRRDFQDTIRQFPILGSIPIIGALFRSTNFQKEETELVIIVTPRLVKPVRAAQMKVPTDRGMPPDEVDLFLLGRTDSAVGVDPLHPTQPSPVGRPTGEMPPAAPAPGGMAALDPSKLEKDYGHAL